MLQWKVGDATITSIPESQGPTSPRFLFEGLGKQDVLARAEAAPWLRPHFVTDDGLLADAHPVPRRRGDGHRIAVDTVRGQRQGPPQPRLEQPPAAVPRGPDRGGLSAGVDHRGGLHAPARRPRRLEHAVWSTGSGCRPSPTPATCSPGRSTTTGRRAPDLYGDDVFGDSVAPIHDAGLADLVRGRPPHQRQRAGSSRRRATPRAHLASSSIRPASGRSSPATWSTHRCRSPIPSWPPSSTATRSVACQPARGVRAMGRVRRPSSSARTSPIRPPAVW